MKAFCTFMAVGLVVMVLAVGVVGAIAFTYQPRAEEPVCENLVSDDGRELDEICHQRVFARRYFCSWRQPFGGCRVVWGWTTQTTERLYFEGRLDFESFACLDFYSLDESFWSQSSGQCETDLFVKPRHGVIMGW